MDGRYGNWMVSMANGWLVRELGGKYGKWMVGMGTRWMLRIAFVS